MFNTGDIVGGGEISFFDLLSHIDSNKFKRFVVCPKKGALVEKLEKNKVQVDLIEMTSIRSLNFFKIVFGILKVYWFLSKNKIDLVHANGSRCAIYAGIASKFARIPMVWHVRVMSRDKWLDPFLARCATKIIVNSKSVKRRFYKVPAALGKATVIYNGFDFSQINPKYVTQDLRKELNLSKATPVIGMTGRMDMYKDHKTFLGAAKIVLSHYPNAQFLLAGSGEKAESLKNYAQEIKIEHAVHFLGNRDDILNVYSAIDIFVLSTRSEGFGRVLVEALAMGKPVVASRVGGVSEVIHDGFSGLLVDKSSAESLAEAISRYIQNPELAIKLAGWGKKEVQKNFSMESHLQEIEQLYESLLGGGKSPLIRLGIDWREFERNTSTGIARYLEGMMRYLLLPGQQWDIRLFGNQKTKWHSFIPSSAKRKINESITLLWDQVTLPKNLRRERCQLFVSPYFKAPLFSPCPVVLIVNDLIPVKSLYFRLLLRWNVRRAKGIATISESVKKELIGFEPRAENKIRVIPLGVSNQFSPGPSNKVYLKEILGVDARYLLYVGNANPHKNLKNLIASMKDVDHLKLVLCGVSKKNNIDLVELASREKVIDKIHFLKKISDESLLELYRGAECFVFPSLSEGFGLPPLEAMGCGVPVIASRIPVIEEVLGDAACLIDARKPSEISKAINDLSDDLDRRKELIEKGKKRAAFFSEKHMAQSFEAFLTWIHNENTLDSR